MRVTLPALRDHNAIGMFPCYRKVANYDGNLVEVGKQIWAVAMCLVNGQVGDAAIATGLVAVAFDNRMSDFTGCHASKLVSEISLRGAKHGDIHACHWGGERAVRRALHFSSKVSCRVVLLLLEVAWPVAASGPS